MISQVEIRIEGSSFGGINPGWQGSVSASEGFAGMIIVRTPDTTYWAKDEPASPHGVDLSFHCHPLMDHCDFQLLFYLGRAHLGRVHGRSRKPGGAPRTIHPEVATSGVEVKLAKVEETPPIQLSAFFLSRSQVSVGRNRIWRPHKAILHELPNDLIPAFIGSRHGSFAAGALSSIG